MSTDLLKRAKQAAFPRVRGLLRDAFPTEAVDAETLEKFALAVAKPGSDALLIDKNNRSRGFGSIREAARSGACFAVDLRDDLCGLDVDTNRATHYVMNELLPELETRKLRAVVWNSGAIGHLHLLARIDDPTLKAAIEDEARRRGCDVRAGQRIRPPLSPHRLSLPVSLVTPSSVAEALLALAPTDQEKYIDIAKRRSLSGRIFALLRYGDRTGRYLSKSEVIQAIATSAVNRGYSEEWLLTVLMNPQNLGGEKVQRMSERDARRYVVNSY